MHKSFKTLALAGSAMALAMTGTFAAAQEQMPDAAPGQTAPAQTTETMPTTTPPPAAEQDAIMQSWPAARQAGFKAWPAETQSYFWSLNQQRQEIFWALSDSDKVKLSQMPEAQRESTWAQIESQITPPRG